MIVIAIIGILAAIAIPAYQDYITRSQVAEAVTVADGMKVTLTDNMQNGDCSDTKTASNNSITGKYVQVVVTAGAPGTAAAGANAIACKLTGTYGSGTAAGAVSSIINGKTIALDLMTNGSIHLDAGTLPAWDPTGKYVPKAIQTS
jgi:type IV pilus assembly protein PilA